MLRETAQSLSDFLNENSSRFISSVLDFGDKGWVIVGERLPGGSRRLYSETIAEPADYLRRCRAGLVDIDPEYHALIADWLELQGTGFDPSESDSKPLPKLM